MHAAGILSTELSHSALLYTAAAEAAESGASAASAAAAADVQAALVKRVLPALSEQLIVKNEVRCSIAAGSPRTQSWESASRVLRCTEPSLQCRKLLWTDHHAQNAIASLKSLRHQTLWASRLLTCMSLLHPSDCCKGQFYAQ